MKWEKGRQNSGYFKLTLWSRWNFDIHILKFPIRSKVLMHTDTVDDKNHHRLNIILKHAELGGHFSCPLAHINTSRIKYFRPDIQFHSVSKIIKGTRYVLSIGWVTRRHP